MTIDVWQGCAGYWQPLFIREHLLPLGHAAWGGYITQGRGVVMCEVVVQSPNSFDWSRDRAPHHIRFLGQTQVPTYLRGQGLTSDAITALMESVQTYPPEQDVLLLISHGGQAQVTWLQNLAIAPPDCYRQVCARRDEFTVAHPPGDPNDPRP